MMILKFNTILLIALTYTSGVVFGHPSSRNGIYSGDFKTDTGRGNKDLLVLNPRLEFLGTYENKMIYIERTAASQENARTGCQNLGMNLLVVQSSDELNWIFEHTVSTDDRSWTAGMNKRGRNAYEWPNGDLISEEIELSSITEELGLQIDRWTTGTKLFSALSSNEQYYLCSTTEQ